MDQQRVRISSLPWREKRTLYENVSDLFLGYSSSESESEPDIPFVFPTKMAAGSKRGRPSVYQSYPMAMWARQFLNSRKLGANRGRSETIGYLSSTIGKMRNYIFGRMKEYCVNNELPAPGSPSWCTVRRLGLPPNRSARAASYYKGLVDFKKAKRDVNASAGHRDEHYANALVSTVAEACAAFRDEVGLMSCDNKNKVIVGAPANSAIRRPPGMHMVTDCPSMPDHTFPAKRAKLIPFGYMEVSAHRERSRFVQYSYSDVPYRHSSREKFVRCMEQVQGFAKVFYFKPQLIRRS